jgi:para-aminobenzoate synthetase component 1
LDGVPFVGGWLGWVSYDFGRVLEPRVDGRGANADRPWPGMLWRRCEDALVHDARRGLWWGVGESASIVSDLRARERPAFRAETPASGWGEAGYRAGVERVLRYIRDGDAYQVNLAHRFSSRCEGDARAVFERLLARARPWHAAYVEGDVEGHRVVLAGASPELFLEYDPRSRRLSTRPMKGTRRSEAPSSLGELETSVKDRAELAMIVDLMRNDLARVCELGSVRVDEPRRIERHAGGTILQATALVSGTMREGVGLPELLRATFPPGSVTGAPKVRAMQIIDELEPVRRGPYCGCAGWVSDSGHWRLGVSIRTAAVCGRAHESGMGCVAGGTLDYSAGAGIVADSDPESEWHETLAKAGILDALRERI